MAELTSNAGTRQTLFPRMRCRSLYAVWTASNTCRQAAPRFVKWNRAGSPSEETLLSIYANRSIHSL
jgi:hypothetical protein